MRFALSVLLSLIVFAGCGARVMQQAASSGQANLDSNKVQNNGTVSGNTTMNEEEATKPITLKATAQESETALVISYEVQNRTDQQLYLWDLMVGFNGTEKAVDHDSAFVFFEEPHTVRVVRANIPLPKLRQVGKKQILFARSLPPGGKLTGKVTLPKPVKEYSDYYEAMTEEGREVKKCSVIRLFVGWTAAKPGMRIEEKTVDGEKVFNIRGSWEGPYQEILEAQINQRVDLLTYTTTFERQMPLQ